MTEISAELREQIVRLQEQYRTLMRAGWEMVAPESLVACPSCRAVVMFTDAEEHREVAHGDQD